MQAPSEALFLAQIVLLLLVGRLLGEAMQRIGQPAVMGQLIAGILLGPSVFGAIWPEAQRAVFAANPQQQSMIDAVSQLGILMLLLLTGMETDLRLVKQAGRAAISASIAGIAVPFACGFALGELLPPVRSSWASRFTDGWTLSPWVRACSERQSFLRRALRSGGVSCSASSAGPTTVLSAKCQWSPQFSSSWARWRSPRT